MPGAERLPAFARVQLPHWQFLGDEAPTLVADTRAALTLPSLCTIVEIRPEGAEVYFSINGLATTTSGGYIPEDGAEIIGPLSNLNTLTMISTGTPVVHVLYFREV